MMAFHKNDRFLRSAIPSPCRPAWRAVMPALLLTAAMLVVTPQSAHASTGGANSCSALQSLTNLYLAVVVNGECTNLSELIGPGSKPGTAQANTPLNLGNGISINAFWDADPFILFGVTTQTLSVAPITYQFMFSTPVVPGAYTYAEGTITGSVTGAGGIVSNSAGEPTFLSGFGSTGGAPTNLGVGVGTGPCTAPTVTCGNGTSSNTFAPVFMNMLIATVTYTQSGVGSTATFSGRIDLFETPPLTTVPEPSTYALMAVGLAALAVVARRRV